MVEITGHTKLAGIERFTLEIQKPAITSLLAKARRKPALALNGYRREKVTLPILLKFRKKAVEAELQRYVAKNVPEEVKKATAKAATPPYFLPGGQTAGGGFSFDVQWYSLPAAPGTARAASAADIAGSARDRSAPTGAVQPPGLDLGQLRLGTAMLTKPTAARSKSAAPALPSATGAGTPRPGSGAPGAAHKPQQARSAAPAAPQPHNQKPKAGKK
jgi:hypothetical protein